MFSYNSSYFYLILNNVMFYSRQLSNERSDEDSDNKASHDHIVSIPTN